MNDEPDDLLRRAQRLQQMSADATKGARRKYKQSGIGRTQRHAAETVGFVRNILQSIGWIRDRVITPLALHPWSGAVVRGYGRLWRKWTYRKDADGDPIFSKQRGGLMILGTLGVLWMVPGFLAGTLELAGDTTRMLLFYKKDEIWYLGKSQEIDPAGNVFSVQGCASIRCSDQTSIYFRIKPSLAHHIWSFYHRGNMFFPDFVAGGVQNDINKCRVTGYGPRWKLMVRNWDIYPQILSVDCMPVSESDITAEHDSDIADQ